MSGHSGLSLPAERMDSRQPCREVIEVEGESVDREWLTCCAALTVEVGGEFGELIQGGLEVFDDFRDQDGGFDGESASRIKSTFAVKQ